MLKRKDLKFKLSKRHKEFAVIQFAHFMRPKEVVKELDTLYDKCTEQLENADPDKMKQLVPTMLKIIQTIQSTINAIPFDEIENEEDEFETVAIHLHLKWVMGTPDPLDEEDEQKLREMLQTEAPFEKIRNFIEYLRCKNQDILGVRRKGGGPQEYIRGRRFHFAPPATPEAEGRHPNTGTLGSIEDHINEDN